jgi:general transcription factor 3C polypeptide 5 (transcription factor C subunit 1)
VVRRLVPKRARGKRVGAFILDYESQEIPKESPMKADQLTELEIQCRNRLVAKFNERPIWTRQALEMNVPPQDVKRFKAVLPTVAYFFRNGPWRHTWVKYGYDPRKHPESKMYALKIELSSTNIVSTAIK